MQRDPQNDRFREQDLSNPKVRDGNSPHSIFAAVAFTRVLLFQFVLLRLEDDIGYFYLFLNKYSRKSAKVGAKSSR